MTVKNEHGEKRKVVFHEFFPANRKRIEKLLRFVEGNRGRREIYFGLIMRYLTRKIISVDYEIGNLYTERTAKSNRLREIRKKQARLANRWKLDAATCRELDELEQLAAQIKQRKGEITLELSRAKEVKRRLSENIQMMPEVKPW